MPMARNRVSPKEGKKGKKWGEEEIGYRFAVILIR